MRNRSRYCGFLSFLGICVFLGWPCTERPLCQIVRESRLVQTNYRDFLGGWSPHGHAPVIDLGGAVDAEVTAFGGRALPKPSKLQVGDWREFPQPGFLFATNHLPREVDTLWIYDRAGFGGPLRWRRWGILPVIDTVRWLVAAHGSIWTTRGAGGEARTILRSEPGSPGSGWTDMASLPHGIQPTRMFLTSDGNLGLIAETSSGGRAAYLGEFTGNGRSLKVRPVQRMKDESDTGQSPAIYHQRFSLGASVRLSRLEWKMTNESSGSVLVRLRCASGEDDVYGEWSSFRRLSPIQIGKMAAYCEYQIVFPKFLRGDTAVDEVALVYEEEEEEDPGAQVSSSGGGTGSSGGDSESDEPQPVVLDFESEQPSAPAQESPAHPPSTDTQSPQTDQSVPSSPDVAETAIDQPVQSQQPNMSQGQENTELSMNQPASEGDSTPVPPLSSSNQMKPEPSRSAKRPGTGKEPGGQNGTPQAPGGSPQGKPGRPGIPGGSAGQAAQPAGSAGEPGGTARELAAQPGGDIPLSARDLYEPSPGGSPSGVLQQALNSMAAEMGSSGELPGESLVGIPSEDKKAKEGKSSASSGGAAGGTGDSSGGSAGGGGGAGGGSGGGISSSLAAAPNEKIDDTTASISVYIPEVDRSIGSGSSSLDSDKPGWAFPGLWVILPLSALLLWWILSAAKQQKKQKTRVVEALSQISKTSRIEQPSIEKEPDFGIGASAVHSSGRTGSGFLDEMPRKSPEPEKPASPPVKERPTRTVKAKGWSNQPLPRSESRHSDDDNEERPVLREDTTTAQRRRFPFFGLALPPFFYLTRKKRVGNATGQP